MGAVELYFVNFDVVTSLDDFPNNNGGCTDERNTT